MFDLSRIDPSMSEYDQKVELANQAVHNWMRDPDNYSYLQEKKADYIHDKGWTTYGGKRGNLKHELDIPSEAFSLLPEEIRGSAKEVRKWVDRYHPYLLHSRIV